MRNSVEHPGVYCNMRWFLLLTVLELAAMAQSPRAPMDAALQSAMQAPFGQKAALREQARTLFESAPADDPRFGRWAQSVAQLYEQAGYGAQGRAVLQEALERTAAGSSASRMVILDALGSAWEQDGNLLKALAYLEQSAAAEPAPPASNAAAQPGLRGVIMSSLSGPFASSRISAYAPAGSFRYIRLANLYKRLGKPDAVEAMAAKIRAVATNPEEVATFYQQMGQLDEAAAAYQQAAAAGKDPEAQISAWQGLANVYSSEQKFADAAAALGHAIAAAQQADAPGIGNQALWMRQELAGMLQRAGQTGQADEVYAQVLRESQGSQQESQVLQAYANYLAQTKRGAEGEQLLKSYLDSNPNLEPWQQNNLLFGLANVARQNGDAAAAERYQKAAQALQPAPQLAQTDSDRDLDQAQTAINQHKLDDAFTLALAGIDAAASTPAGQQVVWRAPGIAEALAAQKQPARAEQIFERLLGAAQNWSMENMQPLATTTQAYARFLTNQRDRWNEVPAAIERYRSVLISANGADSGQLAEPLRISMEFEQRSGDRQNAIATAQKLLKFQESLSGNTSEPYLTDLQNAARAYESAGDTQGALPLLRQAVTISDLLGGTPNDWRRAGTRSELAFALARAGQFDEAETVMQEAARLAQPAGQFAQQLQQIREMKARAAAVNGGPPRG